MQTMNVRKKKQPRVVRDRIKAEVVKWLAAKYHVSHNTVYYILRGDFNSPIADEVLRDFNRKYSELKKALEV